jgi:hypothetical protein
VLEKGDGLCGVDGELPGSLVFFDSAVCLDKVAIADGRWLCGVEGEGGVGVSGSERVMSWAPVDVCW